MTTQAAVHAKGQALVAAVVDWYAVAARDLPWRRPGTSAWGVLVSEVMLQQTPVARVEPAWHAWLARWPDPPSLAADSPGEAVRLWDRLGYPRRALRLHAAATACVERHGGSVPDRLEELRSLPGVGEYTAAAVASFAFGQRHAVLDTNVRRVHARVLDGVAAPPPAVTARERERALALLPHAGATAARVGVAVMELGALVCTARAPRCPTCPLADRCAWRLAGAPPSEAPARTQAWAGTDRQVRGRLLGLVRAADGPVERAALEAAWDDDAQRERCLATLLADGLLQPAGDGRYRLPA